MRALSLPVLIVVAASLAGGPASVRAQTDVALVAGADVAREVPGAAAADVLTIDAPAGTYVEIRAARPYGDLTLALESPDGTILARAEIALSRAAEARLAAVTSAPGRQRLRVTTSTLDGSKKSVYHVGLAALRPADDALRARAALYARLAGVYEAFGRASEEDARRAVVATLEPLPAAFEAAGALDGAAVAWDTLFALRYEIGDTSGMVAAAKAAVAAWRVAGARQEEGRALSNLGLAQYVAYDKAAIESYRAALVLHEETGDAEWNAETGNRIGWYLRWTGDRRGAIEQYRRVLPLRVQVRDWQGEIVATSDLGLALHELGEVQAALEMYDRALALAVPGRDAGRIANILARSGNIYNAIGDYPRAVSIYRQAVAGAEATGDRRALSTAVNNIALAFENLGDIESARESYLRALQIAREMKQFEGEATILQRLARIERHAGNAAAADRYAAEALAQARASKDPKTEGQALILSAVLHLDRGETAGATEDAGAALAIFEKLAVQRWTVGSFVVLGEASARRGEFAQAIAHGERALAVARALGSHDTESFLLAALSRWRLASGHRAGARTDIERAVELGESLRQKISRRDWRSSFLAARQPIYAQYIDVLMDDGPRPGGARSAEDVARALEVAERARARSLLEIVAESRVDVRAGVDDALLEKERDLRGRVNYKASELDRLLSGKSDPAVVAALAKDLDALTAELREVETDVRARSPRYAALTQAVPLTADAIRAELDPQTVLLEIALGEKRSWLWAVTHDGLTAHELPGREALEAQARALYTATIARQQRRPEESAVQRREGLARADRDVQDRAAALSRALFGPIAARLAGEWKDKRLALVAPEALELVPFAALPDPADAAGARPLVAAHEIVSLPSASVLAEVRRDIAGRTSPPGAVAVVADPVFEAADPRLRAVRERASARDGAPIEAAAGGDAGRGTAAFARLPFSREEADAIGAVVPKDRLLRLTGFDADAARVTGGDLAKYRIVHFATHGLLHTDRPDLSGLALSFFDREGRAKDGFLRLNDLYNLRLPVDLVVLSACQTALGREVRGEGLVGLTRGFMYAGAPRVVASLWKVDDLATAELMRRFYRGMLKDGLRPAAALRAAQVGLRGDKRWAAPYYWAGFVLQGDWR